MSLLIESLLSEKYRTFKAQASRLKSHLMTFRSELAAGPIASDKLIDFYKTLGRDRARLIAFSGTVGITQHAKDAENNQSYDIVAEISSIVDDLDSTIAWIDTTIPQSGGYVLSEQLLGGVVTPRSFSASATAPLRTLLQTIINAITDA